MNNGELIVRFPKVYKPLDDSYRYKVLYGGRAAARSWTIARKLLLRGTQEPLFILCTRELQKSIKQSVHKLLKSQINLLHLNAFYTVLEQSIKGMNGTEFTFLGVKSNPDEIRSMEGIDICWIEEGHSLTEGSFDIIDPTVRKEGSEIWISFNTRYKYDHLYKKFVLDKPPKNSLILRTSYRDNPYLSEVLKEQLAEQREEDYEKYLHIWEGELKKLAQGAIFGKQIAKIHESNRLINIPIVPNCVTYTFSDLGKSDQTAIWFMQIVGMEYRFIDYFEGRLEEVSYYAKFITSQDYIYGMHYLPHDAAHDRLGMSRNISEQFQDAGVKPVDIVPVIPLKVTAIELAREILHKCWFHLREDEDGLPDDKCEGYVPWTSDERMRTRSKRMERGYETLCSYRYKLNENDNVYSQNPLHDWASNGADAFMQFAQSDIHELREEDMRAAPVRQMTEDEFSFTEYYDDMPTEQIT